MRTAVRKDRAHVRRLLLKGLLPGDSVDDVPELDNFISRALGTACEPCWVAEASGVIVGTIALTELTRDTAQIRWIRVAKPWQANHVVARPLVRAAVEHARQVGSLKLIFHVPPESEADVASFLHLLGFEFSRHKLRGRRNALEFYLNFYQEPEQATPEESSNQWWKDGQP